jgi:hypothetical protein
VIEFVVLSDISVPPCLEVVRLLLLRSRFIAAACDFQSQSNKHAGQSAPTSWGGFLSVRPTHLQPVGDGAHQNQPAIPIRGDRRTARASLVHADAFDDAPSAIDGRTGAAKLHWHTSLRTAGAALPGTGATTTNGGRCVARVY